MKIFGVIGVVVAVAFLLVLFVPYLRGVMGQRRTAEDLPDVARRLGLRFEPNPSPDLIGRVSGTFRGRDVVMRPDNFGLIRLPFRQELPVFLASASEAAEGAPDLPSFDTGDAAFDRAFPVRRGSQTAADRMASAAELRSELVAFASQWGGTLGTVTLSPTDLSVQQKGGSFQMHYGVPTDRLEEILGQLVAIADRAERTLR